MFMSFTDYITGTKSHESSLRAFPFGKVPQLKWVLQEDEGLYTDDMGICRGFSVPVDIILTKKETDQLFVVRQPLNYFPLK